MNILFVTSFEIKQNSGGVQRVTQTLTNEFRKLGHNVIYLSLSIGNEALIDGIQQYFLPFGRKFENEENILFLKRLLKFQKIEIIINQSGFQSDAIKFIFENKNSTVKLLTVHHNCLKCLNDQYHNIYLQELKSKGLFNIFNNKIGWLLLKKIHKFRFGREIEFALLKSDRVILLSENFINELGFYFPNFDKRKVLSIPNPNPFPIKDIRKNKKENRIVYIGRILTIQKRVERLIEIWEKVSPNFIDWHFDIVGEGPDLEDIQKKIKNKGLERIYLHGRQNPKIFLEKAKIFTLVSDFEGFPMVLIEAQSFGVVPLSFDSFSSIRDIINNNSSGIIIKKFDLAEYIKTLENLIKDNNKLEQMSIEANYQVRRFDTKIISEKWQNLFEELMFNNNE